MALSPRALLATNRYVCEICHKGFQRDQNLQLHRRGHNLPWKLKQKGSNEVKKRVYVCPETGCPHHDRSRALGDLTGIKKHYSRKHCEKKWKCEKCSKKYAVQSDWKAHSKICGTKEYCCDCGTIFSRKDSFVTHRAFCDALAENYMANHGLTGNFHHSQPQDMLPKIGCKMATSDSEQNTNNTLKSITLNPMATPDILSSNSSFRVSGSMPISSSFMSATALLQKASEMGARDSDESISPLILKGYSDFSSTSKTAGFMPNNESRYVNSYAKEVSSETGITRLVSSSVGVSSYVRTQTSSKRNDEVNLISSFRTNGGESAERKNGKMTQDFLGLGASGSTSVGSAGNSSYNEDEMLYSYHQMSNEPVILGKNLWDY